VELGDTVSSRNLMEQNKGGGDETTCKIVLVGDGRVGKSSLMGRFCYNQWPCSARPLPHSVGFGNRVVWVDECEILTQVWDPLIHDHPLIHSRLLSRNVFRKAKGVVIVYSAVKQKSFESVRMWVEMVRDRAEDDFKFMLLGSKCDQTMKRVVEYIPAREFADENEMLFFEVSAKDGTNIDLAFVSLIAGIQS